MERVEGEDAIGRVRGMGLGIVVFKEWPRDMLREVERIFIFKRATIGVSLRPSLHVIVGW